MIATLCLVLWLRLFRLLLSASVLFVGKVSQKNGPKYQGATVDCGTGVCGDVVVGGGEDDDDEEVVVVVVEEGVAECIGVE